jgi:epoxyqueuosine reductase
MGNALAHASGNALAQAEAPALRAALLAARPAASALVAEHIDWALAQGPQTTAVPAASATAAG